jgi:hypothetical protein
MLFQSLQKIDTPQGEKHMSFKFLPIAVELLRNVVDRLLRPHTLQSLLQTLPPPVLSPRRNSKLAKFVNQLI